MNLHRLLQSKLRSRFSLACVLFLLGSDAMARFCVVDVPCEFPAVARANGTIVGWLDLEDHIVLQPIGTEPLPLLGLDLMSPEGLLKPVPDDVGAAPFLFFLANKPEQITYGNLGSETTVDTDGLVLGARYDLSVSLRDEGNPCSDILQNTSLRDPFGRDSFCTLAGDVNFDGAVTFSDFLVVSQNFGKTDAVWPEGDFDWDRNVGFSDYLMLADNFGSSFVSDPLDVSNVPEPSGAGHCGWILSVCLFVRRRRAIGKKCAL